MAPGRQPRRHVARSPSGEETWHDGGMVVVGVDACRRGWIAVVLEDGNPPWGLFVTKLEQLAEAVPEVDGFAVDIPIGLPIEARRRADTEAKRLLGPRGSSVFFTPARAALLADTHREAADTSRTLTGHGISQQAYALAPKILEAERWLRRVSAPVWEVHPEVSFSVLMGHPATAPKKTWAGTRERLVALEGTGIELGGLGRAGELAGVDDVLDATVSAWSAQRLCRGRGLCIPYPPERDPETGRQVAIWA